MTSAVEADSLKKAVDAFYSANKNKYVDRISSEVALLLTWIGYVRPLAKNTASLRLLDAVQGAVIETAGCLTLGAVRPAIFSLRVQLELLIAWIFFEDHPVEWISVETGGRDFPMRSYFLKYFGDYGGRFSERFKQLEAKSIRSKRDLYSLLSTYVHSTNPYAAPKVGPLADIVGNEGRCDECVTLQRDISEYLSDILCAWFAKKWHDLPEPIRENVSGRLTAKELGEFCA